MTHGTDFLRLYDELDLSPDCGLQAFKQAYRRRVSEIHPDRVGSVRHDPEDLKLLNLHYAAALQFHREHGRLPGAAPPVPAAPEEPAPHGHGPAPGPAQAPHATSLLPVPAMPQPRPWARRLGLSTASLLAIAAIWGLFPAVGPPPDAATPSIASSQGAIRHVRVAMPGMAPGDVVAILGEPIGRFDNDERWEYGPSWVRFDCGRMVDWYSSPLRPLRVPAPRPSADEPELRRLAATPCRPPDGASTATARSQGGA